jgi:protein gp37
MTKIEWTDRVWNPVTGCKKISEGCQRCYAERFWPRLRANSKLYAGREFTDVRCHPERLKMPTQWKKPRLVFVNSMGDLFHAGIPHIFIVDIMHVMRTTPHFYQILTKRPENLLYFESKYMPEFAGLQMNAVWPDSVAIGVTVESSKHLDRVKSLRQSKVKTRFVSVEPMLGPVDLGDFVDVLDWVICGGETGPKARPMNPEWPRKLRDQCLEAGVPFFFKQWGKSGPAERMLDGREWNDYPKAIVDWAKREKGVDL